MSGPPSERAREVARLHRYRDLATMMAGDQWTLEASDGQTRIVCQRSTGERVLLAVVDPDVTPAELDLICGAHDLLGFFLTMQDRATAKVLDLQARLDSRARGARETDYAAQAAMLCNEPRFWRFLETKATRTAVANARQADTRLKVVLGFQSKRQLNSDAALLGKFRSLLSDFELWKRNPM